MILGNRNFQLSSLLISYGLLMINRVTGDDSSSLGQPIIPKPRALHSSVILKKDLMVVFGGVDGGATDPYTAEPLLDLLVFNLTSRLWYAPEVRNPPTQKFKFQAAANYNNTNTMYVYTGTSSPLLSLDTDSWEWTSSPGPTPGGINNYLGSTMVASGNILIVYGGVEFNSDGIPDTDKVTDTVYVYDLASRKWLLRPNGNRAYFHSSCVAAGQPEALTFGGATTNGDLISSVISLSTTAFQFYLNRPSSQIPPQLIGASLSCFDSSGVLLGGGGLDWRATSSMVQVINNTGGANPIFSWSQPNILNGGSSPGARIGHSAATLGDDIYVYGGVHQKDTNVYKLNTLTWEWEILKSAYPSNGGGNSNGNQPDGDGGKNNKGSDISPIVIISIVSALFGVLTMGVIIAVFLRRWRQKQHGKRSPTIPEDPYQPPDQTRAWIDNLHESPLRHSAYFSSHPPSFDATPRPMSQTGLATSGLVPSGLQRSAHPEGSEMESVTVADTSNSILSGQGDDSTLAPTRYLRPLSPLGGPIRSHRALGSEGCQLVHPPFVQTIGSSSEISSDYHDPSNGGSPSVTRLPNESGSNLRSNSDIVSPLDRISRLQPSLVHSPNCSHEFPASPSELSTPSSSIKNWPFVSKVATALDTDPTSPPFDSDCLAPVDHTYSPSTIDLVLQQELDSKYRILASSLTSLSGKVTLIQATEVATLHPVTIVVYQDKPSWEKAAEMLQILEGPFTPHLKEMFTVTSHQDHYILVHDRLGTPLPDLLRRQVQPFSDGDLRVLIKGVASILNFCHDRGVVLADLKPADFVFAPDHPSRLMLARVDACLIEGDPYPSHQLPRYCPPEVALASLSGSDPYAYVAPSMDTWALGCLIYELYVRKPVMSSRHTEEETLQFLSQSSGSLSSGLSSGVHWHEGVLQLPEMGSLPDETYQTVQSLLRSNFHARATARQILALPMLTKCPSQFSLVKGLPNGLPAQCQTGEIPPELATSIIALRRQLVATSEIIAPRLVMILPTSQAADSWQDPTRWDSDTFLVYFLCEGPPGLHFTRQPGLPLLDPHSFLAQAGLLIAITAQLCSMYLSPDLLGELDPTPSLPTLFSHYHPASQYFQRLAQLLELYIAQGEEQDPLTHPASELVTLRDPTTPLATWLPSWLITARTTLTTTRHLALPSIRTLIPPDLPLDLQYTKPPTVTNNTNSQLPTPKWLAWLCPTHTNPTTNCSSQ